MGVKSVLSSNLLILGSHTCLVFTDDLSKQGVIFCCISMFSCRGSTMSCYISLSNFLILTSVTIDPSATSRHIIRSYLFAHINLSISIIKNKKSNTATNHCMKRYQYFCKLCLDLQQLVDYITNWLKFCSSYDYYTIVCEV